jgi:hypothetical protein
MDMWDPYVNSVRAHLDDPDTKIVFDPLRGISHKRSYVGERIMGLGGGGGTFGLVTVGAG